MKFGAGGRRTSIQDLGPDILHDGQIIAVVLADTFEAAREGAYRGESRPMRSEPPSGDLRLARA